MTAPTITVLTPTYERARRLRRLYESLVSQTANDFEWLVVDDGSSDETPTVMASLIDEAPFPVRYLRKENGGRHTAINLGVREARGSLCAVIDDDDWYAPSALERLRFHWDAIPDPQRFAEVQGLCMTPDGTLVGSAYPEEVFDSDYFDLTQVHNVTGDKLGMIRTEVLRRFPFPEQFSGSFVDERIVWNRISASYLTRGVNEFVGYKEYLETGISSSHRQRHAALSEQRLLFYTELLAMGRRLPAPARLRAYANLVRNGLHQHASLSAQLRAAPEKLWWLLGSPIGAFLYLRDRIRA
jgi:glycosyltransferase involved in cell wall biosynthesis